MANEFQIQGLDPLLKKMRALPKAVGAKGARFAGRKAANLIRNAAVERFRAQRIDDPKTSEDISKNIAVRFASRTFKRTGDVMFRIGVMGGARQYAATRDNVRKRRVGQSYATGGDSGNPGGDTFYWRFVELGTQRVGARPFLRPALEENAEAATSEFTGQLNRWLDRYVKKQGGAPSQS